jgi:hypothetical protein
MKALVPINPAYNAAIREEVADRLRILLKDAPLPAQFVVLLSRMAEQEQEIEPGFAPSIVPSQRPSTQAERPTNSRYSRDR